MAEPNAGWIEGWRRRARQLKLETYTLYLAYRDPRTPWYARIFTALVVAYAFSPIDLIPDFIPVLGYLDDLVIVPLGITLALRMIPPQVASENRQKAQDRMREGKPQNWFMGAVIVVLWLAALAWVAMLIYRYATSH